MTPGARPRDTTSGIGGCEPGNQSGMSNRLLTARAVYVALLPGTRCNVTLSTEVATRLSGIAHAGGSKGAARGTTVRGPCAPSGLAALVSSCLRFRAKRDLPRAPSLELYVLPIGGGQQLLLARSVPRTARTPSEFKMELRGVEPLTSAVRLQRSPN